MTPRWPLFALFAAAIVPFAAPALGALFVSVPAAASQLFWWFGIGITFATMIVAALDAWLSPRLSNITVEREASPVMSVGARNAVRIWLTNRNSVGFQVEFTDEPPEPSQIEGLPAFVPLPARRSRFQTYIVRSQRRGPSAFGDVFLRCQSRWRFWTMYDQRPLPFPVKVYPDIQAVHGVELLGRKNRLAEAGVRTSRFLGRGNEFDRLRDYRREDEPRHIDWKATARHQRLISREYVVERNQHVVIVLDCGRGMCNAINGLSHFDRALNAAIMLSYVALRQGDYVGMLAVGQKVQRVMRPVRGATSVQSVVRHTYDLQPGYAATDYALIRTELRRRFRKRSLVVLLTHALDELHLASIGRHMRGLVNPHLVLTAFLKNTLLFDRINAIPQNDVDAFQMAAAAELLEAQSKQVNQLAASGVLVLDAAPEQLTADLLSKYLDIKARHLL
jgi:uncharacterized protein (DUF58 family)